MIPRPLRSLLLALPLVLAVACDGDDETTETGDTDDTAAAVDADNDGYTTDEDCDDSNPDIHPGATEDCTDPADLNCDGDSEYADADGDGFAACEECNDALATVNPDAEETCNQIDDDCDGMIDDADDDTVGQGTWYDDADNDGFGDPGTETISCRAPDGYIEDGTDCLDTDRTIHPDAEEICDGSDNDCDGDIDDADDSVVDQASWWADADKDLLGDPEDEVVACDQPDGYVDNMLDCDDSDDTSGSATVWYEDRDEDGWGSTLTRTACEPPTGFVAIDGDCDDRDFDINPGADEICDGGIDNDCDGDPDDDDSDVIGLTTWYEDVDEDGYGDADSSTEACDAPTGFVADGTDCDDSTHLVHPGRFDFDDDEDNDCDGSFDEDVGSETYTHDSDIQSIWNARCTGCHGSSGGLSLSSSAHGKIVNVGSKSSLDYVTPGDPEASYLFRKLENTHLSVSGGSGSAMPLRSSIPSSEVDKIETWILEGAVK